MPVKLVITLTLMSTFSCFDWNNKTPSAGSKAGKYCEVTDDLAKDDYKKFLKKGHSAIARCEIDCDDIEVYEIKDGKPSKNWEFAKLARYLNPGTQWKLVPFDFMETNFKLTSNSFLAENLCEQIKVKGEDKRGKVILIEYRE